MLLEASQFTVIAPLLPHFVDDLGMSKTEAGILSASHGVGAFVGAIPGGALATRLGSRTAIVLGLAIMAAASLTFGLASTTLVLIAARFMQGVAGGVIWPAGLAWVSLLTPARRRGEALGSVAGIAVTGSLLGPPLGSLAVALSPEAVFGAIPALCLALTIVVLRLPADAGVSGGKPLTRILSATSRKRAAAACWLVFVSAAVYGLVLILGPLRLAGLGAGPEAVGAVFLVAALARAGVPPAAGRVVDRGGRRVLVLGALLAGGIVLPLTAAQTTVIGTSAVVIALVALGGTYFVPAATMLREAATAVGLSAGQAFGLVNLPWALGHAAGAMAGGGLAELTSDLAACALLSVALLATFLALHLPAGKEVLGTAQA